MGVWGWRGWGARERMGSRVGGGFCWFMLIFNDIHVNFF